MIETAAIIFITTLVVFVSVAVLVRMEQARGERIILARFRLIIDDQLEKITVAWHSLWHDFSKYVVRLGWYYSVHSLLRFVLNLLVSVYTYFEDKFEHNRRRTKELRKEKKSRAKQTHLAEIATHKTKISLTSEQQEKLLKDSLEQDH